MDQNVVAIIGRLGRSIEAKFFGDNKCVAKFSLAVNGFKKDETHWIDCEAWNKTAEFLVQYTEKGSRVSVSGSLKVDTWEDKDGNKRSKTLVSVQNASPIDWANDSKGQPAGESYMPPAAPAVPTDDEPPF